MKRFVQIALVFSLIFTPLIGPAGVSKANVVSKNPADSKVEAEDNSPIPNGEDKPRMDQNDVLPRLSKHGEHLLFDIQPRLGPHGSPDGIAADSHGTVYLLQSHLHRILRFDIDGRPLGWIGGRDEGDAHLSEIHAIATGPDGSLFTSESLHVADEIVYKVQRFDSKGQFVGSFRTEGHVRAVAPDGSLIAIVPHLGNDQILHLDTSGRPLHRWEANGGEPVQLGALSSLAVSPDGRLFMLDSENRRVHVFQIDGTYLHSWGQSGSEPGQLGDPNRISIADDGTVFIMQHGGSFLGLADSPRVQSFTLDGDFLQEFNLHEIDHAFSHLQGIAVGGSGNSVFLMDSWPEKPVYRFSAEGELESAWQFEEAVEWESEVRAENIAPYPTGSICLNGKTITCLDANGGFDFHTHLNDDDYPFDSTFALAVFSSGKIMASVPEGRIRTFDPDGTALEILPLQNSNGEPLFGEVRDLVVDDDDNVYASILGELGSAGILKFDAEANPITEWTVESTIPEPTGLALAMASDDSLFTLDIDSEFSEGLFDQHFVHQFSKDGELIERWSVEEALNLGPIAESAMHDFAIDNEGRIYIAGHVFLEATRSAEFGIFAFDGSRNFLGMIDAGAEFSSLLEEVSALAIDASNRLIAFSNSNGTVSAVVFHDNPRSTWRIAHYENPHLVGLPKSTTLAEKIDFDWQDNTPAENIPADGFSLRADKTIEMPAGRYQIHLQAEGGVRLWAGELLLVDRWGEESTNEVISLEFPGDQSTPFTLEYVDREGPASLRLDISIQDGEVHTLYLPRAGGSDN